MTELKPNFPRYTAIKITKGNLLWLAKRFESLDCVVTDFDVDHIFLSGTNEDIKLQVGWYVLRINNLMWIEEKNTIETRDVLKVVPPTLISDWFGSESLKKIDEDEYAYEVLKGFGIEEGLG